MDKQSDKNQTNIQQSISRKEQRKLVECCPALEFADLTRFQFDLDTVVDYIDDKKNDVC
jgi:hypothetical protein